MVELVLCDDEKIYRNDLKKILGTELELSGIDYRVTEFSCGEDLLSGLSAEGLQIIFLDIEMKDLDGVETCLLYTSLSIRDVLKSAFADLFEMEIRMNTICEQLCDADEDTMNSLMEELGVIQDILTLRDFYLIDSKVDEIARAFGLTDIGLDKDVTDLSGGQRTRILLGKLLLQKPDILLLDEPTNYLDEEHISWLKRYLTEYEKMCIRDSCQTDRRR